VISSRELGKSLRFRELGGFTNKMNEIIIFITGLIIGFYGCWFFDSSNG